MQDPFGKIVQIWLIIPYEEYPWIVLIQQLVLHPMIWHDKYGDDEVTCGARKLANGL